MAGFFWVLGMAKAAVSSPAHWQNPAIRGGLINVKQKSCLPQHQPGPQTQNNSGEQEASWPNIIKSAREPLGIG